MARIVSDYSAEVVANVITDILSPKPVVLTTIQDSQDATVDPKGKSTIVLNWQLPTQNEDIGGELLGIATGAAQSLECAYDPLVASPVIYEMNAAVGGGGYGDSVLTAAVKHAHKVLPVAAILNFQAGTWVLITEGAKTEYAQVQSIAGNNLTLVSGLQEDYTVAATVKSVHTAVQKTEGTHFAANLNTGVISLVAGAFTVGNKVAAVYATTLQDAHHIEVFRDGYGNLLSDPTYEKVVASGTAFGVNLNLAKTATGFTDVLGSAFNGNKFVYYVFVMDDETVPNASVAAVAAVEVIPSVPQNVTKSVGDRVAILSWDQNTEPLVAGYNIYRSSFPWTPGNAVKVNATIHTGLSFEDGVNGVNRDAAVPVPVNGQSYSYKVETVSIDEAWQTATQNPNGANAEVNVASKAA